MLKNFNFVSGVVQCLGKWNHTDCLIDIRGDIINAIKMLPACDRPAFLLVNRTNEMYLDYNNVDGVPHWTTIINHFIVLPYVPTMRIDILNVVKPLIVRTSDELDDNTVVLVSEKGNAVKIEV